MPRTNMTLEEAKTVVANALAKHGGELDLRPLLAGIPEGQRAIVARMFTELRTSGAIKTTLSVNSENGTVSHVVRKGDVN